MPKSPSPVLKYYVQTSICSAVIFGACFAYLKFLGIPGEINKSLADTAIILAGLSMVISSLCYFFNFLDWSIAYRKYLGLVSFAFAVAHLVMSWKPFLNLFKVATWQEGRVWPVLAGTVALAIFAVMALISNAFSAKLLGGKLWRQILRFGYVAILFVLAHVVLLKYARWVTWFEEGMTSAPSLSLIVSVFMVFVVVMRVLLWLALRSKSKK